jgi:hypothetical protein
MSGRNHILTEVGEDVDVARVCRTARRGRHDAEEAVSVGVGGIFAAAAIVTAAVWPIVAPSLRPSGGDGPDRRTTSLQVMAASPRDAVQN